MRDLTAFARSLGLGRGPARRAGARLPGRLEADARLYSFDINDAPPAGDLFGHNPRFKFQIRSQDELTSDDIDGRKADLVFLAASHELDLNQATFSRLLPLMAPDAILAVHDTGTVPRRFVRPGHYFLESDAGWVGDEREVMPGERAFTVLQRSVPLPRPPEPDRISG